MSPKKATDLTNNRPVWSEAPFITFMSWTEEVKLKYLIARDKFALNECGENEIWWQEFYTDRIKDFVDELHKIQAKEALDAQSVSMQEP